MKFSNYEKKDLAFAGVMISLAFAILLAGGYESFLNINTGFILIFVLAFFTGGIGFLLHELMHKYIAQRYGFWAEFKAFRFMLWIALAASLFGFILAAPGAVFIRGKITKEQNGKISLAGPGTNIVLAFVFFILILVFGNIEGIFRDFLRFGLEINSLLAAFNMIPAMPFDGSKVYAWNKGVYFVTIIIAIVLFAASFAL